MKIAHKPVGAVLKPDLARSHVNQFVKNAQESQGILAKTTQGESA
jgi:hypothetical protein